MRKALLFSVFLTNSLLMIFLSGCNRSTDPPVQSTDKNGQMKFIMIGTGGITGVYYPTGGAIAKFVNEKKDLYHINCMIETTGGSVSNVNAIMAGALQFGLVQSDRQYQAFKGMAEWKERGPQSDLRAVFSIYPESVTLMACEDSGIKTIQDLKGKRVNIGNPGSGQLQNSIDALEAAGIHYETELQAENIPAADAPLLIQDKKLDAFFYTVGHPSAAIHEALSGQRKMRFIPITNIEPLLTKCPFYARSVIPIKLYPKAQNEADVQTFGVKATLVTSAKVPAETVYAITREVFENFEEFKQLHPALQTLTKKGMLEGLSAPLHPGAIKYYQEAGLL